MLSSSKGLRVNTSFPKESPSLSEKAACTALESLEKLERTQDLLSSRVGGFGGDYSAVGLSPVGSGRKPVKRSLCSYLYEGEQLSAGVSPSTQTRFSQLTLNTPCDSPKRTCDKLPRNSSVFVWPLINSPSPTLSPRLYCGFSVSFPKNSTPANRLVLCGQFVCSVFQTLVRKSPTFIFCPISEQDLKSVESPDAAESLSPTAVPQSPVPDVEDHPKTSLVGCVLLLLKLHKLLPFSIILLALKLIERVLQMNPHLRMSRGADMLLFTVSVMLAQKVAMDRPITLKSIARITGIPTSRLNSFEREFLSLINYKLVVSTAHYSPFLTKLHAWGQDFQRKVGPTKLTISLVPLTT